MSAPGPSYGDIPDISDLPQITGDSNGTSSVGPAVGIILFIIIFVVKIAVCIKVMRGFESQKMQISLASVAVDAEAVAVDATVNRFLENMAKENPHRYSSQQLDYYTRRFFQKLGSGGFGVVYRGVLPEGVTVAVKVLNNNLAKQLVEEQFMAEVNCIGRTYHLNLVKLYGYCFEPKLKALVYEFMPNGSLDHILFGGTLDWGKRHRIALGAAKGLAYLHEECHRKIIHHDIKPANVLLDSAMNPKVADFGLARLTNKDSTHVVISGFKGTPGYAAPEVWSSYVTHKCDVYSFGMMLFEIVGRRRNHVSELSGSSREWLPRWAQQKLKEGEAAEMLGELGVEGAEQDEAERALKVALWCVQYSPGARPDMSAVVKMLEGGTEVPSPPNPFAYLEQTFEFGAGTSSEISSALSSSDEQPITSKCNTFPLLQETRINLHFQSG